MHRPLTRLVLDFAMGRGSAILSCAGGSLRGAPAWRHVCSGSGSEQVLSRRVQPAARFSVRWPFFLDRQFEHLLRRAGFGARPDELDDLPRGSRSAARSIALINYERIPDDVDTQDRAARLRGMVTTRGAFSPHTIIARRPAAVAVPDGAQQPSAPGEDDALLAQPLRDRVTRRLPGI